MGKLVVMVLSLETIPLGILLSATCDGSLRRRSRFWMRFAGFVVALTLPAVVLIAGSAVRLGSEQAAGTLLWGGFLWGLVLVALAPLLLFDGLGFSAGPADDDAGGPGPGDDRPSPPGPIGGVPLPDAEQSSLRRRGAHPAGAPTRGRPAREPKRMPSRVTPRCLSRSPSRHSIA